MTDGNFTSIVLATTQISQATGLGPFGFFLILTGLIIMPITALTRSKTAMGFTVVAASIFGVAVGLTPIWFSIIIFFIFSIFSARSLFRDITDPIRAPIANAIPSITIQPSKPIVDESRKTLNCLNCGGPNVDRVTCEWCGKVL